MNGLAKELSRFLLQDDAETDYLIEHGAELHRKGFCRMRLNDAAGKPVRKATVKLRQKTHQYLFGCNAFMQGQFPSEEQNRRYEEVFSSLFNEAVIPFYWSDLEPVDGQPRFEHGAKPVYRRPPPDDVLDFCKRNAITPKGHPLCWHSFVPDWAPQNSVELMRRLERRIAELAERYGDDIFIWDCVNEAQTRSPLQRSPAVAFPDDHVERAFQIAARHFPLAQLIYNDDNQWWNFQGDCSPVYLLASRLQEHGCRLGGLGLQYHMFDWLLKDSARFMNPRVLYRVLDQYAKLNVPVNFSEVSIISRRDLGDGDRFQELVAERLYRIWFSHPATESIVWWNLVDGTAAYSPMGGEEGENSLRAGLVNYDLTPKPAFRALDRLINREWRTDAALDYEDGGDNVFRGFYGLYDAEIVTDAGTFRKTVDLNKHSDNQPVITLN